MIVSNVKLRSYTSTVFNTPNGRVVEVSDADLIDSGRRKEIIRTGYDFYFKLSDNEVLLFPITPGELNISLGSNNEVVTLINEGDINILKSPALIEVEFEARFPMRQYPYSRVPYDFQHYFDVFKKLKEDKLPFRFIVSRQRPEWDTNLLMALEKIELQESADEGDDVIISFTLKEYKEYGVQILKKAESDTTSTSSTTRAGDNNTDKNQSYIVKSGDILWNIAKMFYGDGSKWPIIYDANKSAIEEDAKKHGKASSSNGHLIWSGLELTIPAIK